jgi:hypothetical protein
LDQLVEEARAVIGGVRPQQLRDSSALRTQLAGQLSQLGASLDAEVVDRPRRNILRRAK